MTTIKINHRTVLTQWPKRSGPNAIMAASSAPVPSISPQCNVTGSLRCLANKSAGSNDDHSPIPGLPERSTPHTSHPQSRK